MVSDKHCLSVRGVRLEKLLAQALSGTCVGELFPKLKFREFFSAMILIRVFSLFLPMGADRYHCSPSRGLAVWVTTAKFKRSSLSENEKNNFFEVRTFHTLKTNLLNYH